MTFLSDGLFHQVLCLLFVGRIEGGKSDRVLLESRMGTIAAGMRITLEGVRSSEDRVLGCRVCGL